MDVEKILRHRRSPPAAGGSICKQPEPGGYNLRTHLWHVVHELPGDDVELGFPRAPGDLEARCVLRNIVWAAFAAA